ncbi:MAG TPA: hypothetical protein DDZ19_04465 [Flavobacteriales bacterium]|nr:hypothetical protein [Flavobacteriales bacterium]
MKRIQFGLLVAGMLSVLSTSAQDTRDVATHQHTWFMAFGNHRLSDTWGVHTEYQFRRTDLGQDWQQSLMRIGLDWHRSEQHVVTAGYGWIRSYPYGEQPIAQLFDEHRIWQQLITKSKTGAINWTHRYRLEQRFMDRPEGSAWQHRARYFVQISWSIPNHTNWSISAYEEAFIGLRDLAMPVINLLQQNRLSAALNYRLNNGTSLQVGWLQQVLWKGDGRAENNQTLLLGVRHDLDLRE